VNDSLLRFYIGSGADHRGRTLAEILRQSDDWMEVTHDYVQWLFPLPELSRASVHAPLLDVQTCQAFHTDELLRRHLQASVARMIRFFGLTFDGVTLGQAANWSARCGDWYTVSTHNSLRITRMLRCMSLLGLQVDARALSAGLALLCDDPACGITAESRQFWQAAVIGTSTNRRT
jgi:hypothetical protein